MLPASLGKASKIAGRRGRCVRRSREPSLPVARGIWKYFFAFTNSGVEVVRGDGVQLIITSKGPMSKFWLDEIYKFDVGAIKTGTASGPFSFLSSSAMRDGMPSSFVSKILVLWVQNKAGVRPWAQASWSSAAP